MKVQAHENYDVALQPDQSHLQAGPSVEKGAVVDPGNTPAISRRAQWYYIYWQRPLRIYTTGDQSSEAKLLRYRNRCAKHRMYVFIRSELDSEPNTSTVF